MSDSKSTPRQHTRQKTKLNNHPLQNSIGENLQVQFKKPSVTNERLVVNKLGMKFDPVCWKKNHEKGRIQFICIEQNCKADRRLACAHCIIEEHDEHVSNKITVEQYCEVFDTNFKSYMFQVAKLEENYKKCKMLDMIDQIDRDLNILLEIIKQQFKLLKEYYIQDIQNYAETNNQILIQLYNEERQILSKMKDYSHKNLYEMTPSEMDHSMLLMGSTHIEQIVQKLLTFEDSTATISSTLKAQWKMIFEQLDESIRDIIQQVSQNNLHFPQSNGKETPINQVNILLQDQQIQEKLNIKLQSSNQEQQSSNQQQQQSNQQSQQNNQQQKQSNSQQQQQQSINTQQQQQQQLTNIYNQQQLFLSQNKNITKLSINSNQASVLQQSSNQSSIQQQQSSNQQTNSPKASSENPTCKQISGISQQAIISPLKSGLNTGSFGPNQKSLRNLMQYNNTSQPRHASNASNHQSSNQNIKIQTQTRQMSPNGLQYYYQSDGKQQENRRNTNLSNSSKIQSFERRHSAQKIQNHQFTCNNNSMKCIHNDLLKANPIFSCCNWAFPCYECHDMISNHKAHITKPSQRYCAGCQEIFTVNLMSTVDVKCYKCQ